MYRLRPMRIIWIELYVVLLLSSRLKRRKGKERKDYFSSDQISNEIYKYPFDEKCFSPVSPREVTLETVA